MKHFVAFAKFFLYLLIGAALGMIVMFFGVYMKATSVANDIARSALILATQDGCINYDATNKFCEGMNKLYCSQNVLVNTKPKCFNGETLGSKSVIENDGITYEGSTIYDSESPSEIIRYYDELSSDKKMKAHYGLIYVEGNGKNLLNNINQDYESHVQRGDIINVYSTVEANMHINFIFHNENTSNGVSRHVLRFSFPVNATASGISCKWYKGE